MEIFVYRQHADSIEEGFSPEKLPDLLADRDNLVWVDIERPTDEDNRSLSEIFNFHPLTIEDAIGTKNHPKIEAYKNYVFLIVHGVTVETDSTNFVTNELDIYLGPNFLVTYRYESFPSIDSVKQQIRTNTFQCERGSDYLLHQILDRLVDLYIPVIDDFDNHIHELEARIFEMKRGNTKILGEMADLKRNVTRLSRISSKQIDVLSRIARGEFPFVDEDVLPFFRNVYDHLHRLKLMADNYGDLVNGLQNIYFNVIATKTNDVVKLLTVFSAIILPLTLIAGIYGMNFENMPELKTKYGYLVTIGVMILVTTGQLIYFWRKGWIFDQDKDQDDQEKD